MLSHSPSGHSPSGGAQGKPASVLIITSCVTLKFDVVQNIIDAYEERTVSFLSLTVITKGKLALLYLVFNRIEILGHLSGLLLLPVWHCGMGEQGALLCW